MKITERDLFILTVVYKFRFALGRHIKELANFSGMRSADRRLKVLVESGYLTRKKYLYGVPYLYTLAHKGRVLLGVNKRAEEMHEGKITHDIYVLEAVIFFIKKYSLTVEAIESEKELHVKDGYGIRKHQPDFVFSLNDKKYAVEIELTLKTKARLEQNIRNNYLNFDGQIWLTHNRKVRLLLQSFAGEYPNMQIKTMKEVKEND